MMIKIYGNNLTDKGGKMIIIELIISFQLMNKIFCYLCRFAISIEKQKFFFRKTICPAIYEIHLLRIKKCLQSNVPMRAQQEV